MLFRYNKALFVVMANSADAQGRPLPAIQVPGMDTEIEVEDSDIISLPGQGTMESLVPDIKYADALAILESQMKEIEKDLPELTYTNLKGMTGLSGVAVREMMADAVDKVVEARGNFEAALIKADKQALTMAKFLQLPGFEGIGNYEAGDFDHRFTEREVLPVGSDEKSQTLVNLRNAGVPLGVAMKIAGYDEDITKEAKSEAASERVVQQEANQASLDNALMRFNQQ